MLRLEQITSNEQSANMYEDARHILGHLNGLIEAMKPILTSLPSYIEDRGSFSSHSQSYETCDFIYSRTRSETTSFISYGF